MGVTTSPPALAPGQKYYVLFRNTSEPSQLFVWGTRQLTSFQTTDSISLGTFDVANIALNLYANYFNEKYSLTGHLWQQRPFSCVLSDAHLYNAIRYVELNPLAFGQLAVAARLDRAKVHEYILAALRGDKAEALGGVKPLNRSGRHFV